MKKILAMALALLFVAALFTGCSKKVESPSEPNANDVASDTTEEVKERTSADNTDADSRSVKIGFAIIGGEYSASAIGGGYNYDGTVQDVTVTINGTTGNTTVNASCQPDQKGAISAGNGAPDIIHYDEKGTSPFGEKNSVIVRMYNNASYTKEKDLVGCNPGTLYQTVHNRKYMEEHPEEIVDITKLKDEDLHDWKLVGKVVEPTLEKDGYADYICSIDKCGQTKHVVLPKLTPEPSEPDTPNKPDTPNMPWLL